VSLLVFQPTFYSVGERNTSKSKGSNFYSAVTTQMLMFSFRCVMIFKKNMV